METGPRTEVPGAGLPLGDGSQAAADAAENAGGGWHLQDWLEVVWAEMRALPEPRT